MPIFTFCVSLWFTFSNTASDAYNASYSDKENLYQPNKEADIAQYSDILELLGSEVWIKLIAITYLYKNIFK